MRAGKIVVVSLWCGRVFSFVGGLFDLIMMGRERIWTDEPWKILCVGIIVLQRMDPDRSFAVPISTKISSRIFGSNGDGDVV